MKYLWIEKPMRTRVSMAHFPQQGTVFYKFCIYNSCLRMVRDHDANLKSYKQVGEKFRPFTFHGNLDNCGNCNTWIFENQWKFILPYHNTTFLKRRDIFFIYNRKLCNMQNSKGVKYVEIIEYMFCSNFKQIYWIFHSQRFLHATQTRRGGINILSNILKNCAYFKTYISSTLFQALQHLLFLGMNSLVWITFWGF